MIVREAHVKTGRPSRFLTQFCKHADAVNSGVFRHRPGHGGHGGHGGHSGSDGPGGHGGGSEVSTTAAWTATQGMVTFTPWGRCALSANPDAGVLTLRIEAEDEPNAQRIQDTIDRDLARFSAREPLDVRWRRIEAGDPPPEARSVS